MKNPYVYSLFASLCAMAMLTGCGTTVPSLQYSLECTTCGNTADSQLNVEVNKLVDRDSPPTVMLKNLTDSTLVIDPAMFTEVINGEVTEHQVADSASPVLRPLVVIAPKSTLKFVARNGPENFLQSRINDLTVQHGSADPDSINHFIASVIKGSEIDFLVVYKNVNASLWTTTVARSKCLDASAIGVLVPEPMRKSDLLIPFLIAMGAFLAYATKSMW